MKKYIIVIGDSNDGDYLTKKTEVLDEQIEHVKKILQITGSNYNTRYEYDEDELATKIYKDILTKEDFDLMNKICPYGEYGIHTLESVDVIIVQEEIKLL